MADGFQPRFVDLVRNYTTTEGTGAFVLGSAVTGYRSFLAEIAPGESFYYSAIGIEKPAEFEVGRGTLQADGTITREPIGSGLTSFTGGNKTVALIAASEWYERVDAAMASDVPTVVATRAELAALADRASPAMLHEPRREGLFVFDGSNLSSEVAADPAQGVYVAPQSDPSGASGAWTRKYSGAANADWFGAAGDGVTDDQQAILAAIDFVSDMGGGEVRLSQGTFKLAASLMIYSPNVTIDARDATVISDLASSAPVVSMVGARTKIRGGTWKLISGHGSPWLIDVYGLDCELDGVRLVKEPEAGGYQAYVRHWATGFTMRNCRTEGSNGIFVEASNSSFVNNVLIARSSGGDDCLAIKGVNQTCRNVRIENNHIENHAAGVSIGSEIGVKDADDPDYTRTVGQVVFTGNTLVNCSSIAFIKPGAIDVYDYRDGTVEDVLISNNTLIDETGTKFRRGIALTPGRGARIRNVHGRCNTIRARTISTTGRKVACVDFYLLGYPGGTTEASISDVNLQVEFDDPYGGQSNDASRPGHPTSNFVSAEQATAGIGTMSNIRLDVRGNGCERAGIHIGAGFDDAITIEHAALTGTGRVNASLGGFYADSRVRVREASIEPASGNAYVLGPAGEIVSSVDQMLFCTQLNAGNSGERRPWAAPFRCYVTKVELLSDIDIPQSTDDANYTEFTLRNTAGSGNVFHSVSSALTGGQSFPVNNFNPILLARAIADAADQADCFFSEGSELCVSKNDVGTGRTVRNSYLRIHYAPY